MTDRESDGEASLKSPEPARYVNWSQFNRFTELHPLASPKQLTDLIAMSRGD